MPDREFLVDLDLDARMRCSHHIERGQVLSFAVQLEIRIEVEWHVVVRYDTAHGYAHRDLHRRDGTRVKTPLGMDFAMARTWAQRDILTNWSRYRTAFLGG